MNYKLSDILSAIETLEKINRENLVVFLNSEVEIAANVITQFDVVNNGKVKRTVDLIKNKINEANHAMSDLIELLDQFDVEIEKKRKASHSNLLKTVNNALYTFEWPQDSDYLSHRQSWAVNESIMDQLISLIGKHSDWKTPVLYLEPHTSELTRYLIAGDPFYFVDDRTLPYKKMLETMPVETVNRIHYYDKNSAIQHLEPNSVGMCISWQNFPFKKLGEIRKDIEFMSSVVMPGGYVIFDYVDAMQSSTALAIEKGDFTFQWRDRILQFLSENNLSILHEIEFLNYAPILLFCQKKGKMPTINLNNKLGLVLPDRDILDQRRDQESELKKYYKSITSKLNADIKNIQSRDQLLNQLETQQARNSSGITEQKLKTALGHLDAALVDYPNNHPVVLQAILSVSKLTYALGRIKDSHNLIKRASNDVTQYLNPESSLAVEFAEWINFLNNI